MLAAEAVCVVDSLSQPISLQPIVASNSDTPTNPRMLVLVFVNVQLGNIADTTNFPQITCARQLIAYERTILNLCLQLVLSNASDTSPH